MWQQGRAEDCVQEAFARAWAQREKLDVASSPHAWVRLTAYRLAVSSWRKWRRQRNPLQDTEPPTTDPQHERRLDLLEALSTLKPNFRRALVLHYYADLSKVPTLIFHASGNLVQWHSADFTIYVTDVTTGATLNVSGGSGVTLSGGYVFPSGTAVSDLEPLVCP